MIRRRALLAAAAFVLASGTLARADEVGGIVKWLHGLGFDDVTTSRSLLGRVQIRATGAMGTRELVVNPRTGEILRDVWLDADGKLVRGARYPGSSDDDGSSDHQGSDGNGGHGGDNGGGDDNSGHGGGDDGGNDGEGGDDSSGDGGSEHDDSGEGGSDD